MAEKKILNDNELASISGGRTLPEGWEKIADMLAPSYIKQYQGKVDYAGACELVKSYLNDPEDQELIFEYMKKYFPEEFPEYQK